MDKPKHITKHCENHGEQQWFLSDKGTIYRCPKCRSEAVARNRRRNKQKVVELHGGKCFLCGYNKCMRALQFHHINPAEKEFGLGERGVTNSLDKMIKESKKCVLLCGNCHAEVEDGITKI